MASAGRCRDEEDRCRTGVRLCWDHLAPETTHHHPPAHLHNLDRHTCRQGMVPNRNAHVRILAENHTDPTDSPQGMCTHRETDSQTPASPQDGGVFR
jgi:hypothetical protein